MTFERAGALKVEPQLDGSHCQSLDCGAAGCVVALDFASYGLIRPSTENVRKKMGIGCRTTNPGHWQKALQGYDGQFEKHGLQPPQTAVVYGGTHRRLRELLGKGLLVIAAIHYGTLADRKRRLWASRSYRGNHAVAYRGIKDKDGLKVPTYDSLADGRFRGIPNGRRLWPWGVVKDVLGNVRNSRGGLIYPDEDRWIGLVVKRALPIGEPDPGIELPAPPEPEMPEDLLADLYSDLSDIADEARQGLERIEPHLPEPNDSDADPGEGVDL